ncbi:MAG TPA: LysR family transcriptional regulator [Rhizobium sp.]
MNRASLLDLNAVIAIAAHGNFRAAAAELRMSPSALSRVVAMLEGQLGVRLFNRTTRSVALTEAGEQFLLHVRPALREIDTAFTTVSELGGRPSGTIRINASEGAALQILDPIIFTFLRRYPDMQVDLVTEGRLVDIVAAGFDAGIRLAEAVPQDMVAIPLGQEQRLVVACSPAYLSGRIAPETPADLLAHRCICQRMPGGSIWRWEFEKRGDQLTMDVKGPLTLDNHNVIKKAALAGFGIAFMAESLILDELRDGSLVQLLADWTPAFPGLRLYYSSHRHVTAGFRAFIDVVKAAQSATP